MRVELKRSAIDSNPIYFDMVIYKQDIDTCRAYLTNKSVTINPQELVGGFVSDYRIVKVYSTFCGCIDVDLLDVTCAL